MATVAEFNAWWATLNVDQQVQYMRAFAPPGSWTPDQIVTAWVREHYGALAAYLDQPEIGPLLRQAGSEAWSEARIIAAVQQTQFWRTTTESQRQFDLLSRQDPATAQKNVDTAKQAITSLLSREGVLDQYGDARITDLATQMVRNGVPADQIPRFVLADAAYAPSIAGGGLAAQSTQIQSSAAAFAVPMTDQAAFDWAKGIAMGTQTQEGLTEYLRGQAQAAYSADPVIANALANGYSVRQALDPQLATASQLLGVDADTIDLRDAKWSPLVQYDSGQGVRARTSDETAKFVRGMDEFWQTTNGEAEAVKFVTNLAQQFGKA